MDRTRLWLGLAWASLGVVLSLSVGCSSEASGTKDDAGTDVDSSSADGKDDGGKDGDDLPPLPDAGGNDGKPDPDAGDGGDTGGGDDGGMMSCITSCEEVGAECGEIDNGCGQILDCDGPDNNVCKDFDTCGGGGEANKCGCTPKTCDDVVEGGAECGEEIPDGCGAAIADCGDCSDKPGANWACGAGSRKCECTATSQAEACGARVCGDVADGCDGDGYSCGSCPASRTCDANGACICKDNSAYAATACAGKTCGTVTVDGCTFTCGGACSTACGAGDDCTSSCQCTNPTVCNTSTQRCCTASTKDALCTGQACGTEVTDPCTGTKYTCGCPNGQGCVDKSFLEGATANQCLNQNEASLLGGYVARVHAFTTSALGIQRAESVSLVKISKKQNGAYQISDLGCAATTTGATSGSAKSISPAYFNIPAVIAQATTSGTSFTREWIAPGTPLGFIPNLPPYCDGTQQTPTAANRADFPTMVGGGNTPSSGATKSWRQMQGQSDPLCECPTRPSTQGAGGYCDASVLATDTQAAEDCLPAQNVSGATSMRDCRVNDIDNDGLPGFTAIATNGVTTTAVTFANTRWAGQLDTRGVEAGTAYHTGTVAEPNPLYRQFVSCTGGLCGTLPLFTTRSCGESYNQVVLNKRPMAEFSQLKCSAFYSDSLAAVVDAGGKVTQQADIKVTAIESYFKGTFSCDASNACPTGMVCQAGSCWPKTSPGACTTNAECGAGWTCQTASNADPRVKNSCWPSSCN